MTSQKHFFFFKQTHVEQYPDDIAIWINTTLRKHTNKKVVNHVKKLYQSELNKLIAYMKETGFELSREKTYFMFSYNSKNTKNYLRLN